MRYNILLQTTQSLFRTTLQGYPVWRFFERKRQRMLYDKYSVCGLIFSLRQLNRYAAPRWGDTACGGIYLLFLLPPNRLHRETCRKNKTYKANLPQNERVRFDALLLTWHTMTTCAILCHVVGIWNFCFKKGPLIPFTTWYDVRNFHD